MGRAVIGSIPAREAEGERIGGGDRELAGDIADGIVPLLCIARRREGIGADVLAFRAAEGIFQGNVRIALQQAGNQRREGRILCAVGLGSVHRRDNGLGRGDREGAGHEGNRIVPLLRIARGRDGIGAHVLARCAGESVGNEGGVIAAEEAGDRSREGRVGRAVNLGAVSSRDGEGRGRNGEGAGHGSDGIGGRHILARGIGNTEHRRIKAAVAPGADGCALGGHVARNGEHIARHKAGNAVVRGSRARGSDRERGGKRGALLSRSSIDHGLVSGGEAESGLRHLQGAEILMGNRIVGGLGGTVKRQLIAILRGAGGGTGARSRD